MRARSRGRDSAAAPAAAGWAHFAHEGGLGLRGYGESPAEAFANIALALSAAVTGLDRIHSHEQVGFHCAAEDPEILLLDWLNAVIYEMAVGKRLFGTYAVDIEDGHLDATALGEPLDPRRHRPARAPQGVGLSGLRLRRQRGGRWLAQCIIDLA